MRHGSNNNTSDVSSEVVVLMPNFGSVGSVVDMPGWHILGMDVVLEHKIVDSRMVAVYKRVDALMVLELGLVGACYLYNP